MARPDAEKRTSTSLFSGIEFVKEEPKEAEAEEKPKKETEEPKAPKKEPKQNVSAPKEAPVVRSEYQTENFAVQKKEYRTTILIPESLHKRVDLAKKRGELKSLNHFINKQLTWFFGSAEKGRVPLNITISPKLYEKARAAVEREECASVDKYIESLLED